MVDVVAAWSWEVRGGIGFWRVASLEGAGCTAVFSARLGGVSAGPYASLNLGGGVGDETAAVAANRGRFARATGLPPATWASVRQVHGVGVARVEAPGAYGTADALISSAPGVCLTIAVADCCAVYLVDPVRRAVGLCHAGWRGTADGAAGATVAAMAAAYGTLPADLLAAISPSVGPCCYEVDAPVMRALQAGAPWSDEVLALDPARPGHARLDLWRANALRLRDAGVRAEGVSVAAICTACRPDVLFSHRRDRGRTGRMVAALALAAG